MADLLHHLSARGDEPAGVVIYLGAGAGDPGPVEAALAAPIERLVLVEGDARRASRLQRRWLGHPRVTVRRCVVTASAEAAVWHAHGLASRDGLVAWPDLALTHPRVQVRTQSVTRSVALPELLQEALGGLPVSGSAPVLLLDLPGQVRGLLADFSPDAHPLAPFGQLVIRSLGNACAPVGGSVGQPDEPAMPLQALGFSLTGRKADADGWTTVSVWRQDPLRRERDALRLALQQLHTRCDALLATNARLDAEARERDAQREMDDQQHRSDRAQWQAASHAELAAVRAERQQMQTEQAMLQRAVADLSQQVQAHQADTGIRERLQAQIATLWHEQRTLSDSLDEAREQTEQWRQRALQSVPRASHERLLAELAQWRSGVRRLVDPSPDAHPPTPT